MIRKPTTERLGAFSDGVLAIIITIMVLELKVPHAADPKALMELGPTFFSYALSYLFVGIFWVNHHHLLHQTEHAGAPVIWTNLLALFFVSLIPFFTAYMAENWLKPLPTALYAGDFLLITVAFMLFQKVIAAHFGTSAELRAMDRAGRKRNWIALVAYATAIPAAYVYPAASLAVIITISALYFIPNAAHKRA